MGSNLLRVLRASPLGFPKEREHKGDDTAREEPGSPTDRFADLRDDVASEGRAKAFTTHCPADSPEQEPSSQAHRDHGKDPCESPPHSRVDQPPDQQPDEKKKSRNNHILWANPPVRREEPAQQPRADSNRTRGEEFRVPPLHGQVGDAPDQQPYGKTQQYEREEWFHCDLTFRRERSDKIFLQQSGRYRIPPDGPSYRPLIALSTSTASSTAIGNRIPIRM